MSIQKLPTVTPSELGAVIDLCIQTKQNLFIWGAAGLGKSSIVAQSSTRNNAVLHEFRTANQDALDVIGFPYKTPENRQAYATPAAYPDSNSDNLHIVFLDEFAQGTPLVTNSWSQAILDNRIGEYIFPENTVFIAASNRVKDRANTNRLGSHIHNRFIHVELVADHLDFLIHATENNFHPAVIGYIATQPDALSDFDRDAIAFPSPRAWEFVSQVTEKAEKAGILNKIAAGAVGQGYGSEFCGYMKIWQEMPNLDEILANPETAPLPGGGDTYKGRVYVILTGLVKRCKANPENFQAAYTYLARFCERAHLELACRLALRINPSCAENSAYVQHYLAKTAA